MATNTSMGPSRNGETPVRRLSVRTTAINLGTTAVRVNHVMSPQTGEVSAEHQEELSRQVAELAAKELAHRTVTKCNSLRRSGKERQARLAGSPPAAAGAGVATRQGTSASTTKVVQARSVTNAHAHSMNIGKAVMSSVMFTFIAARFRAERMQTPRCPGRNSCSPFRQGARAIRHGPLADFRMTRKSHPGGRGVNAKTNVTIETGAVEAVTTLLLFSFLVAARPRRSHT